MSSCIHCGEAAPAGRDFCCSGCEAAHGAAARVSPLPELSHMATRTPEGDWQLLLHVSGMHCASCIQLIENALQAEPEVTHARVNLSTERLTLRWQGEAAAGNRLAGIVAKLGYGIKPYGEKAAGRTLSVEQRRLLRSLAVAGFAMGNIMLLSVALWTTDTATMGEATRGLFHWIAALIALPTVAYAGQPFFRSALAVLRERHTNMDVPISIALILACAMSLHETITGGEHTYFDSAVMLLFFLLIGRYLDARARTKAWESAQNLLSMLSGTAMVLRDGRVEHLPIRELRPGMCVLVASGERIPSDGVIREGVSELDTSLITGESLPRGVKPGEHVFGGTLNLGAPLTVEIAKASEQSLLSDIVRLMEKAEQAQARYTRLADRAARLYTPVVHAMGLLAFLGWWLGVGVAWQQALLVAITVLIITCPCALGLAVPVVQVLASTLLMKRGILLKSGDALEKLAAIDTIAFDKTGTLTLGRPVLEAEDIPPCRLQKAASLAVHSRHPLSQAVAAAWQGKLLPVTQVREEPGQGIEGFCDGGLMRLGRPEWCRGLSPVPVPEAAERTVICFTVKGETPLLLHLTDALRPVAKETVAAQKAEGLRLLLLSGDRAAIVEATAASLGIDDAHAELTPVEKTVILNGLAKEGHRVLMVGDGLNDAPSLASAHVSISPSSAIDIAQNTADIVFQGEPLSPVLTAWRVAVRAQRLVKQNFALAVIYNMLAIPLAVMGYVTPLVAALAMSGSSLIVIGNSFRLRVGERV